MAGNRQRSGVLDPRHRNVCGGACQAGKRKYVFQIDSVEGLDVMCHDFQQVIEPPADAVTFSDLRQLVDLFLELRDSSASSTSRKTSRAHPAYRGSTRATYRLIHPSRSSARTRRCTGAAVRPTRRPSSTRLMWPSPWSSRRMAMSTAST